MSPLTFEWDPRKAAANLRKHRVSFEEALTAFRDPVAKIHSDPDHSVGERREILVGHSAQGAALDRCVYRTAEEGPIVQC